jgi:hypothetical protein
MTIPSFTEPQAAADIDNGAKIPLVTAPCKTAVPDLPRLAISITARRRPAHAEKPHGGSGISL